jgi:hypothetical protein
MIVGDDIRQAVETAVFHGDSLTEMTVWRDDPSLEPIVLYLISETIHIACRLYKSQDGFQICAYRLAPVMATDIFCNTEKYRPPVAFSNSTGSSQTFSLIEKWLDVCTRTHEVCHVGRDDSWIPSRLLELGGSPENSTLYLRTHFQDTNIGYLTLSHRWGHASSDQLLLTAGSSEGFRNGIAVENIPKTFQDMVEITKRLGFRYLWIDCMCILQDDPEDWRKESAMMGKVYANSRLNIAATWAEDSNQGCFRERDLSRVATYFNAPCHSSSESQPWVMIRQYLWLDEVDQAPLNKRGWVLQERILSPRVIHFAKKQVFWECRQFSACESFPSGAFPDDYLRKNNNSLKTLVPGETEKEYQDRSGNTPAHYWDMVVSTYATCDLTFRTDRLIALSGIAHKVQAMIQSDYLAGLWSSHIPYNLMWQPNYYRSFYRSPEYVAPSWSWASVDRTFIWVRDSEAKDKKPHLVALNYGTTLANPHDRFGQVVDGFIEVRAKLGMAEWILPSQSQEYVTHFTLSVTDAMTVPDGSARDYEPRTFAMTTTRRALAINLDVFEDNDQLGKAYFLPVYTSVSGEDADRKAEIAALLLLRRPCGRFRRVGVAWLDADNEEEVLGSLLEHDITII